MTVTQKLADDGVSIVYSVKFSSDLGDVSMIQETTSNVNAVIIETVKGVPSGNRFQLVIQNGKTGLFKFSDPKANV